MSHGQMLIVEDEAPIRVTLAELFADRGYEVTTAENGAVALQRLEESVEGPCLILLDLMMPVMNGWDLLKRLRRPGSRFESTPIIIMSASDYAEATCRAFAAAATLPKPLPTERLLPLVDRFCGH